MTEAEACIAALDRHIAVTGEEVALQRQETGDDGQPFSVADITCIAHVRAAQPQDIMGDGNVPDSMVIMSPTAIAIGWPGLPRKDDRIFIQGRAANIEEVAPFYMGTQLVRIELHCRG